MMIAKKYGTIIRAANIHDNRVQPRRSKFYFMAVFFICLISDIVNYNTHFVNILTDRYGLFTVNDKLNSSSFISQNFLMIIATILTIFFAVTFVVVQGFRNRYPLKFIEKYINIRLIRNSTEYIINLFFGAILIIVNIDLFFTKLIYIINAGYCILLFINSYKDFRIFDASEIINSYKVKLIEAIDKGDLDEEFLSKNLKILISYSEESFSKNELSICKYIIEVYRDILIHLIKNIDSLILCGSRITNNEIEKMKEIINNSFIHQLKLAANYDSTYYLEESFSIIKDIFDSCIDCDKLQFLESFSEVADRYFRYCIGRDKFVSCEKIINIYGDVCRYIIEKRVRNDWLAFMRDKLQLYSATSTLYINEKVLKSLIAVYFAIIEKCVEENRKELIDNFFKDMFMLLFNSLNKENNGIQNYVKMLFIGLTAVALSKKDKALIIDLVNKINEFGEYGFESDNREFCISLLQVFHYIETEYVDEEVHQSIRERRVQLAQKAIQMDENIAVLFIPNYASIINNNLSNEIYTQEVINKYKKIIVGSLLGRNLKVTFHILAELHELLMLFPKDKRVQQEKFVDLFEYLISYCIHIKASENFHILLDRFMDCVIDLDKDDKISEELCNRILKLYETVGKICISEKQSELCISINSKLEELTKVHLRINRKRDFRVKIIEIIFQLGLHSVENNLQDIIRNSSNKIGWIGFNAIENNEIDVFREVIDRAISLINICIDLEIDNKTIVFIGTLFIILGASSSSRGNAMCLNITLNGTKKIKKLDILHKSKLVRQYESNTWDEHLNYNANKYINKFFDQIGV